MDATRSANGAKYDSQGQVPTCRDVAPGCKRPEELRPERPKYHPGYYALSGLEGLFLILLPGGDALRCALLAIIFRAFGATLAGAFMFLALDS